MARADAGQLMLDIDDGAQIGYRGPTVSEIVGISYRQLDYWARTGLVEPSFRKAGGSGTQRLYSFEDVVRLKVVKHLLDAGVSLQKVRVAVDELRARGRSLASTTLIADESTVYAMDDDSQLLDLLRRGQTVIALALDPVVNEVEGEITAFPTERVMRAEPADDTAADDEVAAVEVAAGEVPDAAEG